MCVKQGALWHRVCQESEAGAGGSNTSTAKGKDAVLWQEQKQGWDFTVGLRWTDWEVALQRVISCHSVLVPSFRIMLGHQGNLWKSGHGQTTILRSSLQSGWLTLPMKSRIGLPIFHKNVWLSSLRMSAYGLHLYYLCLASSADLLFHKNAEQLWKEI